MEQIDIKDLKIAELEKQKKEVLDYIEKTCIYDKHLQGYCMGLKPGEVKTLVYKLGGRNEKKN